MADMPGLFYLLAALCGAGAAGIVLWRMYKRRLEAVEREAREMQRRMEKLEQVRSVFVANVTHELKTPLTSIRGYLELLRSGPRDERTRRDFYDIIDIETERLQSLIEDILQLSEIENSKEDPRTQSCDIYALGEEIRQRLRPQAERGGIDLRVRIPEGLQMRGNARRLMQMLGNLADNAVKYNKPGGHVLMRAWREEGRTALSVSDTGIGIPEEHLEHIFERFYRVDKGRSRALGGTGLGLSIVKHVVQLHGGSMQVKSTPGKGTHFLIKIPD